MAGLVVAFFVALAWSYAALWVGPRIGLVDMPGGTELKIHKQPTPLLGGVGVYAGIHSGLLVEDAFSGALFAGSSLVLLLGLADDRYDLSPRLRLVAEVAAAAVLVTLMDLGSVGASLFGLVLVVVAINAVNLLDGLDGLVGSVTLASAAGLAWASGQGLVAASLGAVLAGAIAGFLVLNRPKARIFLGDNGAYLIGLTLAYGALTATPAGIGPMLLIAAGVLGVFAIDLAVTILRRRLSGKALFAGDRSHIYDQLRDRGWSIPQIDLAAAAVQGLLVAVLVGFAATDPDWLGSVGLLAAVGVVSFGVVWRLGFVRP
ncbi:MAG: MraY family glycosyltransferase [Acidimicrobiia bacterium]|nr:MraY family glycosyltransferase [Acidimicrobiia bacterium]